MDAFEEFLSLDSGPSPPDGEPGGCATIFLLMLLAWLFSHC